MSSLGPPAPPAGTTAFTVDRRRLRRPKKAELIADEIRRWIVRRQLKPGDRLPNERELIQLLGSSRGSVREAFKILEAQGLVEVSPGARGGARVASISYDSANFYLKSYFYFQELSWAEVYDMREQVEPRAAELATPHLTAADLEALERTVERCCEGISGNLSDSEHRLEEGRFHRILIQRCPNPMLRFSTLFVLDMLVDFIRYRNVINPETEEFAMECFNAHKALLPYLKRRDGPGAARRMREHIRELAQFLSDREQIVEPDLLLQRTRKGVGYDEVGGESFPEK